MSVAPSPNQPSRFARVRSSATRGEWGAIFAMFGAVALLNIVGWFLLVVIIAPHNYHVSATSVLGVGLGVTAYTLGMRHAFDADHIAAIDNTTRKLMADGKRPVSVGFWFSLGHSSVVFIMVCAIAAGLKWLIRGVQNDTSTLQTTASLFGTAVSGVFLLMIGILNLIVLREILKVFGAMRRGEYDEQSLEYHLAKRGFMNRILGKVTRTVTKSWHMFPVGFLFGLGFDTVTEIGLLAIASGAAVSNAPWYAIIVLPILFAAGMSLLDSIDGCFMNFAYGWAFSKPVRKVYYNITITALSVGVALVIGGIEIISIVDQKLGIDSGPVAWIGSVDLNVVGFVIVIVFVVTWIVALLVWRYGHIEEKWSAGLVGVDADTEELLERSLDVTLDEQLDIDLNGAVEVA